MTRPLIAYPSGWTLSVIPDEEAARSAAKELTDAGIPPDDVLVLAGPDARERMGRLGTSAGVASRIRRTMQFMTMDQLPDLHVYELALDQGHVVVGVRIGEAGNRRRAIETLRRHGGHFINRFGAWATEEIAAWRGQMPDVPQHLRR